ncbi:MAG: L,D-transpeptidase [Syntrophobacteraceae bacterium]
MAALTILRLTGFVFLCSSLLGCAVRYVDMNQAEYASEIDGEEEAQAPYRSSLGKKVPKVGWTRRVVTEKELSLLCKKDQDLTYDKCMEILVRLNIKDREYIKEDIKKRRVLKAPKDFAAYKNWSPLPMKLADKANVAKFVLVVKDIPFIGWYEKGKLKGDAPICIGKQWGWTRKGSYKVEEKDPWHISQSYSNAYGTPALMPTALRIYGRVWIHGGDIVGPYFSHGCINLPLQEAEKLFGWADVGTPVLIADSLKEFEKGSKSGGNQRPPVLNPGKSKPAVKVGKKLGS